MSTALTARSQRVFPRDLVPGCEILVRTAAGGGWYTDAGTVARGKHGRSWIKVTEVEQDGTWYRINTEKLGLIGASANSKLIARLVTA